MDVRIKVGLLELESVVWLWLALGLVLRLGLVSGLYKSLFYLATVRQHKHIVLKLLLFEPCVIYWLGLEPLS